jgi:hypothetical protein
VLELRLTEVPMKRNNQKRGLQAPTNTAAERAMSRVVEGKKRHRRHVNANRDNQIIWLAKAASRDAQMLT